jgi:hypothetical protein
MMLISPVTRKRQVDHLIDSFAAVTLELTA